jgi:predicted ArsR family transcriptional regulator
MLGLPRCPTAHTVPGPTAAVSHTVPVSGWIPWPSAGSSSAQLAAESADRRKPSQSAPDARLLLTDHGYEPYDDEGTIRLRNCPFAQLAKRHGELVCRANLVFVEGLLQGRQHRGLQAILDPLPQRCCVALI